MSRLLSSLILTRDLVKYFDIEIVLDSSSLVPYIGASYVGKVRKAWANREVFALSL